MFVDVTTFEIDLNVLVFLKLALVKIRCHASPYRITSGSMEPEIPGSPILH